MFNRFYIVLNSLNRTLWYTIQLNYWFNGATENAELTGHRETIKIVGIDIARLDNARPDNAAPDQTYM